MRCRAFIRNSGHRGTHTPSGASRIKTVLPIGYLKHQLRIFHNSQCVIDSTYWSPQSSAYRVCRTSIQESKWEGGNPKTCLVGLQLGHFAGSQQELRHLQPQRSYLLRQSAFACLLAREDWVDLQSYHLVFDCSSVG